MTWSKIANITGPKGNQGITGSASTVPGPTGPTGSSGTASTVPGPSGLSAYQVAVANGFNGTQAQWLISLIGVSGAPGSIGNTGSVGVAGAQGIQGLTGNNGATGSTGATGATGPAAARYSKRLQTNSSGLINVTFTSAFSAVPVVVGTVEVPAADLAGFTYKCELTGPPTTTTAQFRVTKTAFSVSITGLLTLTLAATSAANVFVDVSAFDAT